MENEDSQKVDKVDLELIMSFIKKQNTLIYILLAGMVVLFLLEVIKMLK